MFDARSGGGQAWIELQGAREVGMRLIKLSQSLMAQPAVVITLGAQRRQGHAHAGGGQRTLEILQMVGTEREIKVLPEAVRLHAHRVFELVVRTLVVLRFEQ